MNKGIAHIAVIIIIGMIWGAIAVLSSQRIIDKVTTHSVTVSK